MKRVVIAFVMVSALPALGRQPSRIQAYFSSGQAPVWIYPDDPCWGWALDVGPGRVYLDNCPYWNHDDRDDRPYWRGPYRRPYGGRPYPYYGPYYGYGYRPYYGGYGPYYGRRGGISFGFGF